ncbi:phosphoglycerate dehydrogenase [Methanococcoides orientis]|uniref:phosphoglycerate dehydrogenase n=1 Tax=Methanococcoides orientis TaxID=2822137 RepID=UPI001E5D2DFF|nr:phosphoglycerate dehydrogenase [Methanococcoides orientis]UGV40298.1 phosphoglycerate dehydrogenase [Methanococcoides orientis]
MDKATSIKKVFISTHPFGEISTEPLDLLEAEGISYKLNPYGRKITTQELATQIIDCDALIAGTEIIDASVFENAPDLKLISRVGIGLDGVDFDLAKMRNVKVAFTPDAPTVAVAELCMGLILDCLRRITATDRHLREGKWHRHMGGLLYGKTVGIIGLGRIGKTLVHLLQPFNVNILANDIDPDMAFGHMMGIEWVDKDSLLENSDVVSLNIPLTESTFHLIDDNALKKMRSTAVLINTARGPVVDELALLSALEEGMIAGAAIDVFENEPYDGPLSQCESVVLTCHMGASTRESRQRMELEATEEIIRYNCNEKLKNEVLF